MPATLTEIVPPVASGSGETLPALRGTKLLRDLDDAVIERVAAICEIVHADEDAVVCRQGDVSDRLFIVLDGQLVGLRTAGSGTTAVVEVVRTGETLGLAIVLARLPRLLTVRAVSASRLLAIDADGLMALARQECSLVTALLQAQADEFRSLVGQVCDLKMRTTAQRLGCYLLSLATVRHANTSALRLPFDKRLLAARLGCRQENLSRAFAALRDFGVETHGARVILHDIDRLRTYSEPDEAAA